MKAYIFCKTLSNRISIQKGAFKQQKPRWSILLPVEIIGKP